MTLRVRIVGPESAGKTTVARALAARFTAVWVPEFARGYLEAKEGRLEVADLLEIARGQAELEDAAALGIREPTSFPGGRVAGGLLFCDTDPATTALWARALFGSTDPAITALAAGRRYALTLLLAPAPWVPDPVRYQPAAGDRQAFFEACIVAFPNAVVLEGGWQARWDAAVGAVGRLFR